MKLPHGSVAVVTGAASGIGLSTALRLAKTGVHTYGVVLHAGDVPSEGRQSAVVWITADVRFRADIDHVAAVVRQQHGRLDLVVSNAAVARHAAIGSAVESDLELMFKTNTLGFFHCVAAFQDLLEASAHGAVVAVSSVHANVSSGLVSGYAATKGALVSASRAAALDLAPRGIRVNVVLPGSVDTPMLRQSAKRRSPQDPEAAIREWGASHPIGRILEAGEVAEAIVFLGSPAASGITGTTLVVDGGLTARLAL